MYISAGVPKIKMADMKETKIEMATGTMDMLLLAMRYSPEITIYRSRIFQHISQPYLHNYLQDKWYELY